MPPEPDPTTGALVRRTVTYGPWEVPREVREDGERFRPAGASGPLPPLPDSAYPPGAVPLDAPECWDEES